MGSAPWFFPMIVLISSSFVLAAGVSIKFSLFCNLKLGYEFDQEKKEKLAKRVNYL